MGEFAGRYALRPDRREIAPTDQAFPDQSRRVQTAPELLACCVAREGRRSHSERGMRSRARSTCVSSTYFMNTVRYCNYGLRNGTKWLV